MAFKRPYPVSPTRNSLNEEEEEAARLCQVCGDKAAGFHYGALGCASCTTFFRRHASRAKDIRPCYRNNQCAITIQSKPMCTACRFAKCLAIGMSIDFIRKEYSLDKRYKQKLPVAIQSHTNVASQPSKIDLSPAIRCSMTPFESTLVSNVAHAFDKFIPIAETRQIMDHLFTSSLQTPIDRSQTFNMLTGFYATTESFIRSTSHFQVLTLAEKSSLIHRNMHGIVTLCSASVFRLTGALDSRIASDLFIPIYGYESFQQTRRIVMALEQDIIIIKLMLVILAFSSNFYLVDENEEIDSDSLLAGTFRLFGSQNIYVEALWKYMLDRYNYYDAALRFDRLIKHALDLMRIAANTHLSNKIHQNFVEEITVRTVKSLTVNENEVIPLWGKT